MAQVPPPPTPSGSEVSKVESDVSQTISLADSIVTLLREPVSLLYQNIKEREVLERNLGHWQTEALDDYKQCRIPVLRLTEFETHLVKTDGHLLAKTATDSRLSSDTNSPGSHKTLRNSMLSWGPLPPLPFFWQKNASPQPDKSPPAKACWASLLRALGIGPGMNIVGWRPSNDGFISTQNGGIEMEVDGAVLCHIMNLYSPSLNPETYWGGSAGRVPSYASKESCILPFGRLAWTKTGGEIHAHFEPGPEKELDAEKAPFDQFDYSQYRLDPNTWITTYLTALEHGTSDSDLHLAEIEAPITERIERLSYCMNKLAFASLTPRLVSSAWFEEAARVKRRVLAQGGEDHSFFADICETLDKDPFSHIPEESRGDFREKSKFQVRELFLLDKESFTFWFPGRRKASFNINTIHELARGVLDKYEHQPPGSWKRELYDMREDVIAVLRINNRVFVKHFWFLEFTRESPLWNERVLLGAPSLR
ncbi:uncharacterized protein K444DRAFT_374957 [Hyaloscypha bicolor E]|uniref:Uncharacterized protein n=1 Tax=Hyaloscypha bicolor E TaxID=1095630 RepID=A0A2J6TF31_9HELO|nr:uncharacterized protein K444DRAFT_374957 [Hyaloscypha bicolor E]PMD61637.1 hypothetical protein K444DRAFT_374957 [Hyaloscypha bicolor E]